MTHITDSLESFVHVGQKILVLWKHNCEDAVGRFVNVLKHTVGSSGSVHFEHCDRLVQANYETSTFDCTLIGFLSLDEHHAKPTFIEVARLLKPDGKIHLFSNTKTVPDEIGATAWDEASLKTTFKLSGFTDIKSDSVTIFGLNNQSVSGVIIKAKKPCFEVGSSRQLLFADNDHTQQDVRTVWSLDVDTEDVELVNDDDLLDESDVNKPTSESLRKACDLKEKKRKACINCTCGLADEKKTEDPVTQKSVVSACGSCYLGDAFRCASCPYLGMPAFQPGENVKLSATQMKVDT